MSESPAPESAQYTRPCSDNCTHDHQIQCHLRRRGSMTARPHTGFPDPEKGAVMEPGPCLLQTSPDNGSTLPDLEKWDEPKVNRFRYLATVAGLVIMGLHDAATGALIPYDAAQVESYYDIDYTVVSLLFLAPFVSYLAAALSSNLIHHHYGQRGIAILAPLCRLVGYIIVALHPPFPVLPVAMLFPGFGNGLEDSAWNAWIGNLQNANELLGVLHGAYGAGATIAPLIATAMVTKGNHPLEWYTYYYIMIGVSALEASLTVPAFWSANAAAFRDKQGPSVDQGSRTTTRTVLREPITWLVAFFLLGYVGAEVSLGGWIVTFMLRVRHAEAFSAGLTVTFFWLGLTCGRVLLGFITGRIGEKLAITAYLCMSVALEVLYWLVPSFVASAVFVAFLGFFLGPLFPAAIVAATKLLPMEYHVSAIGFAAALGGGGAAVFPFVVGIIAQKVGVSVLQPIIVAILSFILIMWLILPGGLRRGGLEQARANHERVGHEIRRVYKWTKSKKDYI
ncbi:Bypass of stop codon protein 6 [Cytospora mali]|uniref:Bypass of stop codon protein 6 n=1 Tax=Cytospora mali TaxID=578113 RepID=A0A194V7Z0_CYTMA|nr:Bypass of stop codon protein 6 [Valsa mali var. pyri (nom. inval.)]